MSILQAAKVKTRREKVEKEEEEYTVSSSGRRIKRIKYSKYFD